MDNYMFILGIILGILLGCFISSYVLDNSHYQLLKSNWTCVEANQLDENADKLECIMYKKKEK